MFSPFLRRIAIDVFLCAALALGIYYWGKDFLDFMISLFHFEDKVNLSSMAFIIQRFALVLIPLIFITPKTRIKKISIIKIVFYVVGICYFVGNTWIISYLAANSFSGEAFSNLWFGSTPMWFGNDFTVAASNALYYFQFNNAYVFNYIVWDSYNLFGVVFSTIMGVMFIRFANKLNGNMRKVCARYLMIIILSFILPLLNNVLIDNEFFLSGMWCEKNILILLSWIFIYISFKLSTISRLFWDDLFG